MLIKESMLRRVIREEAIKSLREQTGGYLAGLTGLGTLAGGTGGAAVAPIAAGYRGYQNMQTRSAGLVLRYQEGKNDPRLAALETDVRLVLYGGSATSSFFNMTASAGMFAKDLYFGDGGDFGDMSEASKENIVKQTYDAIKSNSLTHNSFYEIVSQAFKLDPGTVGSYEPQKQASTTTEGTDTFFEMLNTIQTKFASGAPAAVDPKAPPAAAAAAGKATDWPSYVAATRGGAAVQAAWAAYAASSRTNPGFGTFVRWYQANGNNMNPQQTTVKLNSLTSGSAGAQAAAAPAQEVTVTAADTTALPAEAAAMRAADAAVAAAEADPNPLTKKEKIAAALKARQAAQAALRAARQNLRAVKKENLFHSNDSRLNESNRQLKNLKITWGK